MRLLDWILVYTNIGALALAWSYLRINRVLLLLSQVEMKLLPDVARPLIRMAGEDDTKSLPQTARFFVSAALMFALWPLLVPIFSAILFFGPRVPDLGVVDDQDDGGAA